MKTKPLLIGGILAAGLLAACVPGIDDCPTQPPNGLVITQGPQAYANNALDFAREILTKTPLPGNVKVNPQALTAELPLDTYSLDTQQVAQGKGLEAVKEQDSMLYLIDSDGVTIASTVVSRQTGEAYSLDYHGKDISNALKQLAALDQVHNAPYLVRLLGTPIGFRDTSPASYQFIWLKSYSPDGDLIYTLSYTMPELQPNKLYTASEFFKIIQPVAQNRLTMPVQDWGGLPPPPTGAH